MLWIIYEKNFPLYAKHTPKYKNSTVSVIVLKAALAEGENISIITSMNKFLQFSGVKQIDKPLQFIVNGNEYDRVSEGNNKLIIGLTGCATAEQAFRIYENNKAAPHATLDTENKVLYNHTSLTKAACAYPEHELYHPNRNTTSYWINVVGHNHAELNEKAKSILANFLFLNLPHLNVEQKLGYFPTQGRSLDIARLNRGDWQPATGVLPTTSCETWFHYSILPEDMEEIWNEAFAPDEIEEEILSSLGKYPGRPIRMGSKSKKIPEIKEFLKLSGSDFDKEMENSIKLLQFSYGLPETGVIDKDTWNALTSEV